MTRTSGRTTGLFVLALALLVNAPEARSGAARQGAPAAPVADPVYQQIKAFALATSSIDVSNFVLKRDRVEMTFNGTFFLAAPVNGKVTGAVFIGQGTVHADAPPSPADFEKESMKRLLGADVLESDFKTAVLRMTDDTAELIQKALPGRTVGAGGAPQTSEAQSLASKFEPRLLHDTGLNLSSRLATSMLNGETPGVFFAEFDGGKRSRFDYVLDYQTRVPSGTFGVNGGEKGLVFAYQSAIYAPEIWMGFYAQGDYGHVVPYSDSFNQVDVTHYAMDIDLHTPSSKIGVSAKIDMTARASNLRAVSFKIGEEQSAAHDNRLNEQMRLKSAQIGGQPLAAVQEDWEGGVTVFLPAALNSGDKTTITLDFEGNFMFGSIETFYLYLNDCWFPRQGELDRATFDLTYHHLKRHIVASPGVRLSEEPDPARSDWALTKYRIDQPVALVAFAAGQFERSKQTTTADVEHGGQAIPMEFFGINAHTAQIGQRFILDEMDNAVRYFANFFGKYPYPSFGAVLHPRNFGQGFATMLFLAPADSGNYLASAFIAHETAHQWWGNVVAWRSYRDQWLSEGFAEYSAMLYARERDPDEKNKSQVPITHQGPGHSKLIKHSREQLLFSPQTTTGIGKGRLADIGPIILGGRLNTSKSFGAYTALTYDKGSLVLRMLHFLLENPSSGNDTKAFFSMMSDFVDKYRDKAATTEQFFQVAGEHFAQSPIGAKYNMTDLNWFLKQWVYGTSFPSYTLEYELQVQPDNTCLVVGTLHQDNAPADFTMPLPIVFTFASETQIARTTVLATGPTSKVQLKLPTKPTKVELDPASWILSEKTTTKGK